MKLNELVKSKRKVSKYSRGELADKLGVTIQTIKDFEDEEVELDSSILWKYLNILNVSEEEFTNTFISDEDSQVYIKQFNYSRNGLYKFEEEITNKPDENYIFKFPTIYLGVSKNKTSKYYSSSKNDIYVGEASSIIRRTQQHLDGGKKDSMNEMKTTSIDKDEEVYVIGHSCFNKSATLELEQMFMNHLLGDDKFTSIRNKRDNGLPTDFYKRDSYRKIIFPKIWSELHKKGVVSDLDKVKNSILFANSPFKTLNEEQQKAKDKISARILATLTNGDDHKVIRVSGLAGSGKTILLSSLFISLVDQPMNVLNEDKISSHESKTVLVVRQKQQLNAYAQIAKKLNLPKDSVMDVSTFINNGKKADIVLVDEAHVLWSGNYGRVNAKKWKPDLIALRELSKSLVLIYDESQVLSARGKVNDNPELLSIVNDAETIPLTNQWRITANKRTQDWILNLSNFSEKSLVQPPKDPKYDIQFFDDDVLFREAINKANKKFGMARMISTYDWKYSQGSKPKKNKYWTVNIGKQEIPWNLQLEDVIKQEKKGTPWQEIPESINEVGSDFTIQGSDLKIAGVILGPSVTFDAEKQSLKIIPEKSLDKQKIRKQGNTFNTEENELYLRNVLNVLLTRGVNGLYIYAADRQLQEYIKKNLIK